jgi:hypothetical protein
MLFYFTNLYGNPVAYKVQIPGDAWTQNKGGKTITVIRASCWARMGAIGGVVDVPDLTEIQILPSSDNNHTIGVKYVVRRGEKMFTGFGSSNEFSLIKKVDIYQNKGGGDKEVVSGNALHALEMATKRAKVAAIATALGFDHNEIGDIVESYDYIINPALRKTPAIGYKHHSLADLSHMERAKIVPVEQADNPSQKQEDKKTTVTTPVTTTARQESKPATPQTPQTQKSQSENNTDQASKPASTPPKTESTTSSKSATPPTGNKSNDNDNPGEFVINFGKHKGKALITILSEDSSYIKWLVENSTSPEVKAKATALMNKLPNLANQNTASSTASTAVPFKELLKKFWQTRGYDPKTEVKDILESALSRKNLSYGEVTEEEAKGLYEKREHIFPEKNKNTTGASDENDLDAKTKALLGKTKCCVCEIELKEPEIKVSLKKADDLNGRMMCFRHVRLSQGADAAAQEKKCEKCQKVLDQQELQFIKEYDSAQLCTDCQVG